MSELKKAIEPLDQHDACDDCGKRSDGLMICTYVHDDTTTKLCPTCIKDSGFCLRCGYYSAGCSSFDFSDMPGYCSECRDEIKAEFADEDDEADDIDWDEEDSDEDYEPPYNEDEL